MREAGLGRIIDYFAPPSWTEWPTGTRIAASIVRVEGGKVMHDIRQDVRQALRALAQHKGFTAAALISLALAIGANSALFSVVHGVLLRPLPYPEAERLVRLSEVHPGATSAVRAPLLSHFTYEAWQPSARTLEGLAAYSMALFTDTTGSQPVRLRGASVSPSLFSLLRSSPAAGRLLLPATTPRERRRSP